MTQTNGTCRISCRIVAIITALVVGILTAFLQITGVFVATIPFVAVAFGVAAVYLLGVLLAAALTLTFAGTAWCSAWLIAKDRKNGR